MQKVMELDAELAGEVIQIRDEFAVGPLAGLDTEEGWNARLEWWKGQLTGSPYKEDLAGSFDDRQTISAIKAKLEENAACAVSFSLPGSFTSKSFQLFEISPITSILPSPIIFFILVIRNRSPVLIFIRCRVLLSTRVAFCHSGVMFFIISPS